MLMKQSDIVIPRAIAVLLLLLAVAISSSELRAQRRKRQPGTAATNRVDYSQFRHATKQHQETCDACHKAPTANWKKARSFPDIADYPAHDACVRCHRAQFFKGAQPLICSNCHRKTSPRDSGRLAFPDEQRSRQFKIDFPHDRHQDVIAEIILATHQKTLMSFAHASQQRIDYNNCTICHATNSEPQSSASRWVDTFVPQADSFKTVPSGHATCFNCHWKSERPASDQCEGCHKPSEPHLPVTTPRRISMKFRHEGGGDKRVHVAECTTCHINITAAASLRGLKPDVPITACTECHNKAGLREDLDKELTARDRSSSAVCSYCHTSDIGKRDAPISHYHAADHPAPFQRKDVK
jgi:decaheme cytochrome c component MtrC/MtrF-like protein